jgi:hypothetical protein
MRVPPINLREGAGQGDTIVQVEESGHIVVGPGVARQQKYPQCDGSTDPLIHLRLLSISRGRPDRARFQYDDNRRGKFPKKDQVKT